MQKKNQEMLGLLFIAVAVLSIFIWRAISGQMLRYEMTGFLTGLFFGQIGNYIAVTQKNSNKKLSFLQIYILILLFGVVLITSYFSKYFSFGYFGGFGIIICFEHSLLALIKKNKIRRK